MSSLDEKAREYAGVFGLKLGTKVPVASRSFLWVLSVALAKIAVMCQKLAIRSTKENLVTTGSVNGVVDQGREFLGREPYPAQKSTVNLTTVGGTGITIPSGTVFVCSTNGLTYSAVASVVLGGVNPVVASCDVAGVDGNITNGDAFALQTPIVGVTGAWSGTLTISGVDGETQSEYRAKVLDVKRYIGGGSNLFDLRIWGQEVAGVARCYPYRGTFDSAGNNLGGLSARTVFVQSAGSIDPTGNGIAPQGLLDQVKQSCLYDPITGAERQSCSAPNSTFFVKSIRRISFDVTIHGTSLSWNGDAISAVESALSIYFSSLVPYVGGVDPIAGRTNEITSVNLSGVVRDTASQWGLNPSHVTFKLSSGGGELQTYSLPAGGLAKMGTVEFL